MEKLLTAAELAKLTGIKLDTIYKLSRNNKIPCFKIGGSYRYKLEEFKIYLEENNQ